MGSSNVLLHIQYYSHIIDQDACCCGKLITYSKFEIGSRTFRKCVLLRILHLRTCLIRVVLQQFCIDLFRFIIRYSVLPCLYRLVQRQDSVRRVFAIILRNINLVTRSVECLHIFLVRECLFIGITLSEVFVVGSQFRHIYQFVVTVGKCLEFRVRTFCLLMQQAVAHVYHLRDKHFLDMDLRISKQRLHILVYSDTCGPHYQPVGICR